MASENWPALFTAEELKPGTTQAPAVDLALGVISGNIGNYTRRWLKEQRWRETFYLNTIDCDLMNLQLTHYPVNQVFSVKSGSDLDEIQDRDLDNYFISKSGIIHYRSHRSVFGRTPDANTYFQVEYLAGYDPLPADLKDLVLRYVESDIDERANANFNRNARTGVRTQDQGIKRFKLDGVYYVEYESEDESQSKNFFSPVERTVLNFYKKRFPGPDYITKVERVAE